MTIGKGRYDELCTYVRTAAGARAAIVIIFDGERGSGFSCQADIAITFDLPDILERIAREVRADMAAPPETPQ